MYDAMCIGVFMFGAALYGQGAGFHSASAMYKSALDTIDKDNDDRLDPLMYWIHTVWQHIVAHYIYAVGLCIMQATQAYAYRNCRVPCKSVGATDSDGNSSSGLALPDKVLLCFASVVLGLLAFGVCIQFPAGTIVGFIYLILYGFGAIGGYHCYLYFTEKDAAVWQFGNLPVLNYFLLGYSFAFLMLVCWMIAVGGFVSKSQAGLS